MAIAVAPFPGSDWSNSMAIAIAQIWLLLLLKPGLSLQSKSILFHLLQLLYLLLRSTLNNSLQLNSNSIIDRLIPKFYSTTRNPPPIFQISITLQSIISTLNTMLCDRNPTFLQCAWSCGVWLWWKCLLPTFDNLRDWNLTLLLYQPTQINPNFHIAPSKLGSDVSAYIIILHLTLANGVGQFPLRCGWGWIAIYVPI
jgi:hypothetical protein